MGLSYKLVQLQRQGNKSKQTNGDRALCTNKSGVEKDKVINQYRKLHNLYQLQKQIVRQNMHSAMSPISAISGYLELMDLTLDRDRDVERIERYRKKIEDSIQELNTILEHLHETFKEKDNERDSENGEAIFSEKISMTG